MHLQTNKKYYVMHVLKSINCLDRKNSKIFNLSNGESIIIGKIDSSKIESDCHLFRLGEDVLKHYVSEKFYMEFKKRKLSGCIFNLR